MKLTRTLAERVVEDWFNGNGYRSHRARASRVTVPVGGACPTCHRPYTKTLNFSQDLFGVFDGVSVQRGRPTVWWQVTTVAHSDTLGPMGGSYPHLAHVSERKAKIRTVAADFCPDVVWVLGASTVRRSDNRRKFRRYFQVWSFNHAAGAWERMIWTLEVDVDVYGRPRIVTAPGGGILKALGVPDPAPDPAPNQELSSTT